MATDKKKIREAEEVGPFYAVVNYGTIGSPLWAHGPYETKEEAKEKAKSIRHYFSPTDRSYYHAWCRVYPQAFVDKGLERGMLKINNSKKYTESTPLADRDDYARWLMKNDEEEAKSAKDKYQAELDERNIPIYEGWYSLIQEIQMAGNFAYDESFGFDKFLDAEDPKIRDTGYFDSFSFGHDDIDVHDLNTEGIGIWIWTKDEEPVGGDVIHDFIPKLKKTGGAELCLCSLCRVEDDMYDIQSPKQMINLYAKYLINDMNCSRSQISSMIYFLNEIANGNGDRFFPGAKSVEWAGQENARPSFYVFYDVDVIPTREQISNISKGVKEIYEEMVKPLHY